MRDLLRLLDIEVNTARMKPTIRVMAGEIHRVVDAAEQELAHSRRHYQRGGLIVTVVTDPGTIAGRRVALVLGAEGEGMRRLTRETCDEVAGLRIANGVESLNVSAAAAVALYEIGRPA